MMKGWMMKLFALEENQITECYSVLCNFLLQENITYKWI